MERIVQEASAAGVHYSTTGISRKCLKMKIAVTSTLILAFLSIALFASLSVSEANVDPSFETAQPTPPDKTKPEAVAPRSACSPMATPLSQEELDDPLRELGYRQIYANTRIKVYRTKTPDDRYSYSGRSVLVANQCHYKLILYHF